MASSTRHYGLGYFDFGDSLSSDWSAQIEIDRFVFIDKMLYGLMSIFGNGVINGWNVAAEGAFSVSVSEGYGNINFTAARTTFPDVVEEIPPSSINYIYARTKERTTFAEDVEFVLSPLRDIADPHFLLLAEVITGSSSIESIDNTVRQEIAFLELIKAAIRLHKHRGGANNPSKIDLTSEVKGQLPSFRIADFDAEKITTGTFDLARLPLIDHNDLANIGLLGHPALDTFVKTLESDNKEIFGEIGTANLLQLILAAKLIYDDPSSAFYWDDQTVDQYMINEIAVIPGITPDSFLDFDNSTATIDTEQHSIKGIPATTGSSFYVNYDSALAWNSAYFLENLTVVGDTVTLAFDDTNASNIITIEGFESASSPGQSLAGGSGGISLFKKETVVINDNADITAQSSSTNVLEGFYSGKFVHKQSFRSQFVKEFTQVQDWTNYESFVINIKCLDSIHGAIKLYFESSSGEQSTSFVILDQDEITSNSDPLQNNFEIRAIDLSLIPFRNQIKKFVIFTDDLINPFSFFVDFINIQRAVLLPEEGTLKIRYSTNSNVTFSMLEWNSTEPSGTSITVRARSANGTAFLTRSDFTPFLNSGDTVNLYGTDLEIEIIFTPDNSRVIAPVLNSIRVLILTEAEVDGAEIDEAEEFARGTVENAVISTSPVKIELDTPIYVGSYYFCMGNSINQITETETDDGTKFTEGELAIFGSSSPISPNQVLRAIESNEKRVTLARLGSPRCVQRQAKRTFVVADTYNDRILEFEEDGTLARGVGSVNYEHNSKTFPIAAAVDIRTGILYIIWSRKISFKTVNVSKITLQTATQQIQLIRDFDKILGLTTTELDTINAEGQIMPVYLGAQNAGIVQNFSSNGSFMLVSSDAVSSGISLDSVFYKAIVTTLGIPVFVGNFAYIDGIFSPTSVDRTDDDSYWVANATIAVKNFSFSSTDESFTKNTNVSSIIQIDQNNNLIFGSNIIKFSPFVPGRVKQIDDTSILIGGLKPGGTEGSPPQDAFNFRNIRGDSDARLIQKETLKTILFEGSTPNVGAAVVLDTRSLATTFEYTSAEGIIVSDIGVDQTTGNYVIAESSLSRSGRVIKVDTVGNIVFSFGEGLYSLINSLSVKIDGSIVVST